ncbi:hypothetical protein OIE52_50800 [Streptomyces canus]|uniref:LuxE/PaaK family acyltransferase n=1 Tax=Streptomyces canus TaxID=58343 RepID=UPI0030E18593
MTQAAGAFTISEAERESTLLPELTALIAHHRRRCPGYARILDAIDGTGSVGDGLAGLPWIPVRLFKNHRLASVEPAEVFRVVTSSGTAGAVSRIHLDVQAATAQQQALFRVLSTVLGSERLPMLIADSKAVFARASTLSARGAGVIGLMSYGRDHTFVLDEEGRPDLPAVGDFLARNGARRFLIFGFTFLVWTALREMATEHRLDLSNGVLIHSGGWKRLADQAVDNTQFRRGLARASGLSEIYNYYGMVEQLGTVFLEGPSGGSLYCPDFADVIVRDPLTWREQPVGRPGVIEVLSTLPTSYPGNVLLTEDMGVVHGVDDGDWPGKRFSVLGRVAAAEIRGCSDVPAVGA